MSRSQETVKTVGNIPDGGWSAEESGEIKLSAELGTSDTSELSVKWGDQLSITGCPVKLFRLGFLLFWQLLLIQIAKVGTFLQNSGNLLHNRHKNFENRFWNSWDNWGQSWQPSFRNWHFAITQRQKNNFYVKGGNFDLNYLSYF